MRKLLGILYWTLYWAAVNSWGRGASKHRFFAALTVQWRGELVTTVGTEANIGSRTVISGPASARLTIGPHAWIGNDCEISVLEQVSIGAHTSLQHRTQVHGDVQIGAGCVGAAGLYVSSGWHEFRRVPALPIRLQDRLKAQQGMLSRPVVIGEDCWLGINVAVMPGVEIGRGCVIGANTVVTGDIAPYSIAVGAPARVIGQRLDFKPPGRLDASLDEHLPYFYEGFQTIPTGDQTIVPRQEGGLAAADQFELACSIAAGDRFRIDLSAAQDLRLCHGNAIQRVPAGPSILEFDAAPDARGRLRFTIISDTAAPTPPLVVRGLNL